MAFVQVILGYSHFNYEMANSQNLPGGLPVVELPDGKKISMYEGVIPAIDFKSEDFQNIYQNYNFKFENYDSKTGELLQVGELVYKEGKWYLKRVQ